MAAGQRRVQPGSCWSSYKISATSAASRTPAERRLGPVLGVSGGAELLLFHDGRRRSFGPPWPGPSVNRLYPPSRFTETFSRPCAPVVLGKTFIIFSPPSDSII